MSFGYPGQQQYGTAGGSGTIPDAGSVARAEGRVYQAFLILTGPQTIRDREAIESVIRVIDQQGTSLMAIIVLENGGIVSSNVTQIDFGSGVVATEVSPGVVLVTVGGITSAMITDGAIGTVDLADFSVTTAKLGDLAVTTGKIADKAVTAGKMADRTITAGQVALASGDGKVLWVANTRDTASAGRSSVTSLTGDDKLGTGLLTLPGDQKNYSIRARAYGTIEKTVSGNIEMRVEIRLGGSAFASSDWVGQQFGLQPISSWGVEIQAPTLVAGDSSSWSAQIVCRVSAGQGYFHGGHVVLEAIPSSLG